MTSTYCPLLLADIYLPIIIQIYPAYREEIDIALLALFPVGITMAICIIKRGMWKIRHINHNRKLIKDQDWKDIHMTIPRRIVKYTIVSMNFYIFCQIIFFVVWIMVHFGYSTPFLNNKCEVTKFHHILGFTIESFWAITLTFGMLILQL